MDFKILFGNINDDRRLKSKYNNFCDHLRLENRLDNISNNIKKLLDQNTIVAICEITIENMIKLLKLVGTSNIVLGKYNNDPNAFQYIVFYPKSLRVIEHINLALTHDVTMSNGLVLKSTEFIDNDCRPGTDGERRADTNYQNFTGGELFEKSILVIKFASNDKTFMLVVLHLGLMQQQRTIQIKKIVDILENLNKQILPIIICGDFNGFVASKGGPFVEQYSPLLENGYINKLDFHENTFEPYPYDIAYRLVEPQPFFDLLKIMNSCEYSQAHVDEYVDMCKNAKQNKAVPVALDNIFIKNIDVSSKITLFDNFCSDHKELFMEFGIQ